MGDAQPPLPPDSILRRHSFFVLLMAVLLAGWALRLWIVFQPFRLLYGCNILLDDAYYLASFARETAAGRLFQISPGRYTNGMQPLFVFLTSPAFAFGGTVSEAPMRVGLILSALCGVGTGFALTLWAERLGAGRASIVAGILWALSPTAIRHGLNGMETGLNLFFLASLGCFWPWLRGRPMRLGAMLGVLMLARFDNLLLMPIVAAALARAELRRNRAEGQAQRKWTPPNWPPLLRRAARPLVRASAGFLLVYGPYAFLSFGYTGHVVPQSGPAVRKMSHYAFGEEPSLLFGGEALRYHAEKAARELSIEALQDIVPVPHLNLGDQVEFELDLTLRFVSVIALVAFVLLVRPDTRRATVAGLAIGGLWYGVYVLHIGGMWYITRYLQGLILLFTLGVALFVRNFIPRNDRAAVTLLTLLSIGFVVGTTFTFKDRFRYWSWDPYAGENWTGYIRDSLREGRRVGMFNSGKMGYLTGGRVLNLDGVVNPDAAKALEDKRFHEYLRREQIDLIVDWPFLVRRLGIGRAPWYAFKLKPVKRGWLTAYRVDWPSETYLPDESPEAQPNSVPTSLR